MKQEERWTCDREGCTNEATHRDEEMAIMYAKTGHSPSRAGLVKRDLCDEHFNKALRVWSIIITEESP